MIKHLVSFVMLGMLLAAPAAKAFEGRYHWSINFPRDAQWKILNDQQDNAGYTKVYAPSGMSSVYPQNLSMGFNLGDKTPLRNAMQVVLNQHRQAPCREKSDHLIKATDNMILYTTHLGNCANGKSLFQVIKSYNMPDGNYSIMYAADPEVVSKSDIQKMQTAITTAKLK